MSYGVPDALAKTQRTRDVLTYPTTFPNDFLRVPAFQKSNYKDLNEIVFILTFLFAGGTSRKKIPLPFIFQFPPPEKQLRRQEKKKRKKWAWWLISRCLYGELVVLDVVFYRRRARNAKIVDDALRQRLLLPTDRWFPSKQKKKKAVQITSVCRRYFKRSRSCWRLLSFLCCNQFLRWSRQR